MCNDVVYFDWSSAHWVLRPVTFKYLLWTFLSSKVKFSTNRNYQQHSNNKADPLAINNAGQ